MSRKVNIKKLPKHRQKKVRKTKGALRRGSYCISNKITDDKVVDSVLKDIDS